MHCSPPMEFYFRKALVGLVPVRRFRRLLRTDACRWYSVFRNHYSASVFKKRMMLANHGSIETVVLGSSHGYYGFYAEGAEANLSDVSCDLRLSRELLFFWLDRGLPSLKNVILFLDVFSPGNRLEKSSEAFRLVSYEDLYGIRRDSMRQDTDIGLTLDEARRCYEKGVRSCRFGGDGGYRGNFDYDFYRPSCGEASCLKERVAQHLKLSVGDELRHVDAMRAHLPRFVRLVIVMPPLRADYRAEMKRQQSVLGMTPPSFVATEGVMRCDLTDSALFDYGDFNDMDHLNERGARKLAARVRAGLEGGSDQIC